MCFLGTRRRYHHVSDSSGFRRRRSNLTNAKGELVIGHVGVTVISNNTGYVTLQPGFATFVTGPNDPIPPPFRISDLTLAQIMAMLTSKPGQSGGSIDLPTDQMAKRQGYGGTNLPHANNPPGTDPLGYFSIFNAGDTVAKNKSQANQTSQTVPPPTLPPPPPPVTPPPPPPTQPPPVVCTPRNPYGGNPGNRATHGNYSNFGSHGNSGPITRGSVGSGRNRGGPQ